METEVHTELSFNSIFVFIIGFACAIFVSSFAFVSPLISFLIIIIGFAILVDRHKEVLLLSIIIISFGLGTLRYSIKDFHEDLVPSSMGMVVSELEQKENTTRFVFLADNGEKVLVNTDLYSPVQYGDQIKLVGEFKKPGVIVDEDSGREFDYGRYLSKDDIYYTSSFADIEIVSSEHGNWLKRILFKIKHSFIEHSKKILAEPYASLLMGLIVSGREALPKDILEEFRRAGVIHIVVLSGFNITLIAEFLRKIFRSNYAALFGIILFVIMTGAGASIVRAAIMAGVALGAKFFGRKYSASRALVGAGFLMLLENPKILVFDPSFQLSFLATLGLIYFMSPVDSKLTWIKYPKIREILAQTFATQFAVLPLLIYMMGDVSLVSIPANLLILVTIPYTMLVGFLATLAAYISTIIAWPLVYISYLLLSWILFVSHILGSLSFATMNIPSIFVWVIILVYVIFAAFMKFSSTFRQFKFSKKSST